MSRESVNCNQCGAAIEVAPNINFVTCARCGTPLVVRRTGSSTYTERVAEQTDIITPGLVGAVPLYSDAGSKTDAGALSELQRQSDLNRLENELNRLDLDWERDKEQYMIAGRYGNRYLPTKGLSVVGGVVLAVFGTFWTMMAFGITSGFTWSLHDPRGGPTIVRILFPLFGVGFVIFGVWGCISAYAKAEEYERAYLAYVHTRNQLLKDISAVRFDR